MLRRVLVVEDNDDDYFLTERSLQKVMSKRMINIEVDRARNGRAALNMIVLDSERLKYPDYQLILLDLMMPVMDGLEFLQAIRAHSRGHTVPIVMMSTSKSIRDIESAAKTGVNAYVSKPIRAEDFEELLDVAGGLMLKYHLGNG